MSDDYENNSPSKRILLAKIADEVGAMHTAIEGNREGDIKWEDATRPLVTPSDFKRFAAASQGLAKAHAATLASGQHDWHVGNPMGALLFRNEYGMAASPYQVVHAATDAVEHAAAECDYAAVRVRDASIRLPAHSRYDAERAKLRDCATTLALAAEIMRDAAAGNFDTDSYLAAIADIEAAEVPTDKVQQ